MPPSQSIKVRIGALSLRVKSIWFPTNMIILISDWIRIPSRAHKITTRFYEINEGDIMMFQLLKSNKENIVLNSCFYISSTI